ncbi:Frp1 ferric reductase [Scheffersomyces amazonensis]|uniref:Frp1 ferric reductase n=1 Tax=Scheffersomyces amazonensis TaxID=1078765 RepID=UPI00315CE891
MMSVKFIVSYLLVFTAVLAQNWATYPQVPKTASINGFADPIYAKLPDCAKECVKFNVGNTPCPNWDTGCFCVMPQWSGLVGQCVAQNCKGEEVVSATSLASSLCWSVGANTWMMPASISTALSSAAGNVAAAVAIPTDSSSSEKSSSNSATASTVSTTKSFASDDSSSISSISSVSSVSSTSLTTSATSSTTANGVVSLATSALALVGCLFAYLV